MNRVLRHSLMVALALMLLAGFGCAKKTAETDGVGDGSGTADYDAEGSMTESERQAAAAIADGVVYFAYDSFNLTQESKSTLTQKAELIKQVPQLRVTVEGHCDERGTEEYNLALGERRARAAYEFLMNLGVPANQMEMVSFGKLHPAVEGSGEAAWSKNRRDEFKAYKPVN